MFLARGLLGQFVQALQLSIECALGQPQLLRQCAFVWRSRACVDSVAPVSAGDSSLTAACTFFLKLGSLLVITLLVIRIVVIDSAQSRHESSCTLLWMGPFGIVTDGGCCYALVQLQMCVVVTIDMQMRQVRPAAPAMFQFCCVMMSCLAQARKEAGASCCMQGVGVMLVAKWCMCFATKSVTA